MSLIFKLKDNTGFFSRVLQLASNYIYAKKNNLYFVVDDSGWLFGHHFGWRDYFTSLQLLSEQISPLPLPIHPDMNSEDNRVQHFTLEEYIDVLNEIFVFNDSVEQLYQKQRNLLPELFNAIMIRRGDKMYHESKYISTDEYLKHIIGKNNLDIFVQTDDYTAFEEVRDYINRNGLNINVTTTCPFHKRGTFVFEYKPSNGSNRSELNNQYLLNLTTKDPQKSVNEYTPFEMKQHVEEMLVGLKICTNSMYLSTDYQSNVTRFLLCVHKNPSNVLSVGDISCPSFNIPLLSLSRGFIPSK